MCITRLYGMEFVQTTSHRLKTKIRALFLLSALVVLAADPETNTHCSIDIGNPSFGKLSYLYNVTIAQMSN